MPLGDGADEGFVVTASNLRLSLFPIAPANDGRVVFENKAGMFSNRKATFHAYLLHFSTQQNGVSIVTIG